MVFVYGHLIAAWVLLVSLHQRAMCFMNGGDSLLRILLFLFCFSQAGAGFSVDAWLAGHGLVESLQIKAPPWCTRLLQIQIAIVYFRTFACKMQGPAWLNGTAVLYALGNRNYLPRPAPRWFLNRRIVAWATYGTLVSEFALGTLIWIRELQHPVIIVGLVLHVGMEYALSLQLFS